MYERIRVNTLAGYKDVLSIYEVDKYGNVYGNNGMELKKRHNSSGYFQVGLKIYGERRFRKAFVHRLVALAFVGGRTEEKNEIDHIDGNKENNIYHNLKWCTHLENVHNSVTVEKTMWGNMNRSISCYVYDYLLNYIGWFPSLDSASKEIGLDIKRVDVRIADYYVLSTQDLSNVLKINKKHKIQSVVVTDITTHEKHYFYSNREARRFFDGKVNITDAIKNNWTVRGKYKIRNLNYKKLIGTLDL